MDNELTNRYLPLVLKLAGPVADFVNQALNDFVATGTEEQAQMFVMAMQQGARPEFRFRLQPTAQARICLVDSDGMELVNIFGVESLPDKTRTN